MKKLYAVISILFVFASAALADNSFETPIPDYDDEVTSSGPNTKYSLASQLRYDAFLNAELKVNTDFLEGKKSVKLYKLSKNQNYLQKVKIDNAKIIEYTNGSYDIKFKDFPNKIFCYDKDGNLLHFVQITNDGKIPFASYYYDIDGQIQQIEIKPERYRSYIYDLKGFLTRYCVDDKVYDSKGKLIRRKKSFI